MDRGAYAVEAGIEATHWWFVGRRELCARLLAEPGGRRGRVLDIGTGTGTNLRLLRDLGYGEVAGLDSSPEAARFCREKGLGPVLLGDVTALPFPDGAFALVLATDVIEHVADDRRALAEIRRVLAPGGRLVLTVPAFQALWGPQDLLAHHQRRYRRGPLLRLAAEAGLRVRRSFYFNYLLFLPIWLARRLLAVLRPSLRSENEINGRMLNWLLLQIFRLDLRTAPLLRPPFGVSILLLAERPA